MKKLIFALLSSSLLVSCSSVYKWQSEFPDNPIEEWLEDEIEYYTDLDIDLTPVTGEETQSLDIFKKK